MESVGFLEAVELLLVEIVLELERLLPVVVLMLVQLGLDLVGS